VQKILKGILHTKEKINRNMKIWERINLTRWVDKQMYSKEE
jgi:hypothetical protein